MGREAGGAKGFAGAVPRVVEWFGRDGVGVWEKCFGGSGAGCGWWVVLQTDMSDPVARRMALEAPAARRRRPLTVRQPPGAEQREVDSWSCASRWQGREGSGGWQS